MELNRWRSSTSLQGNLFLRVETYDQFVSVWEFLLSSHQQLVDQQGANMHDLTVEELFKTLLEYTAFPNRGFLGLLQNRKGLNLGYIAAENTTISFRPKELTVFCVFTTEKCPSTCKELMHELKGWATREGFTRIHARMYKKSGAAQRFFNHVLKMRHTAMVYTVEL